MTDPRALSKHVDHIPVIWLEPENLSEPARLVIWLDGLTGHKERMKPYLAKLATAGFVGLSFDALPQMWQNCLKWFINHRENRA